MLKELRTYRLCGCILLAMNMTLSVMIFFMIYGDKTFRHDQIITITMAVYTFTIFTVSIINIVKCRKYNSPVYSASKAINLVVACVSMITLTSTMMTTFNKGTMNLSSRRTLLSFVGGAVSVLIIGMAIYMIVQSSKKIKVIKSEGKDE